MTIRCSVISFANFVFGTSTSIPDCKIGAVIMKMISSTSTTSMNGTMLISDSDDCVFPASCGIESLTCASAVRAALPGAAAACYLVIVSVTKRLLNLSGDFERKGIKPLRQVSNVTHKIVVENHGRNGRKQAHRRGDQRFRDTGRHRAQAGRAGVAQARKRVHNS